MLEDAWIRYDGGSPMIYHASLATVQPTSIQSRCQLGPFRRLAIPIRSQPWQGEKENALIHNRILLRKRADGQVESGPLIAILTVRGKKGGFQGNRSNYKEIMRTAQRLGGLVYVVTSEGIDFKRRRCQGYIWSFSKREWLQMEFPFPHIFYNRIPYRHQEARPFVQNVLEQLQQMEQIHLYPRSFFDKWKLFQWLKQDERLRPHLPATDFLSKTSFWRLARHFPSLYLKPVDGKAGEGVIQLTRRHDSIQIIHQAKRTRHRIVVSSLDKGWERLRPLVKQKSYIVQQGIPLARFDARPFDIRILVQKNGAGAWTLTGIGVRVAGRESITTHVPQGGKIVSFRQVIQQLFPQQRAISIQQKIEKIALLVAKNLEQQQPNLAEFSMDLGMTKEGELWIFEANAKPMKFDEPQIRQRSLRNLIQYAQYRSGFRRNK